MNISINSPYDIAAAMAVSTDYKLRNGSLSNIKDIPPDILAAIKEFLSHLRGLDDLIYKYPASKDALLKALDALDGELEVKLINPRVPADVEAYIINLKKALDNLSSDILKGASPSDIAWDYQNSVLPAVYALQVSIGDIKLSDVVQQLLAGWFKLTNDLNQLLADLSANPPKTQDQINKDIQAIQKDISDLQGLNFLIGRLSGSISGPLWEAACKMSSMLSDLNDFINSIDRSTLPMPDALLKQIIAKFTTLENDGYLLCEAIKKLLVPTTPTSGSSGTGGGFSMKKGMKTLASNIVITADLSVDEKQKRPKRVRV